MSEWKECRIKDISYLKNGKKRPIGKGLYPVYGGNGIIDYSNDYNNKSSIVIGRVGAYCGCVYNSISKCWVSDNAISVTPKDDCDHTFLFYLLSYLNLNNYKIGGAQPLLTQDIIGRIEIKVPCEKSNQSEIAGILSSLDAKIETNNKLNEKLEEMAQAIFKSWFVDFEPFKDKPFHETELGMIPEGWELGSILDIAELFDSQRKPLSSMEREYMKGKYPYYGATSIMDYIDKYIFDGTYLLMGEDGSVVKENGNPYLQYVWGKFWPNNHAHVMQGRNGYSTEMLYCLLSITDVSSIVTGAVQMKISQRSMSRLLTVIPSKSVCNKFNTIIRPIFDIIKRIWEENDRLASLRDTLLPRLMSGELIV
ncbi:MAG: restriction endonuclease subunit S [Prevotella sp.]|nr:restriction endonuclease subunit S [Prevotella sp.]